MKLAMTALNFIRRMGVLDIALYKLSIFSFGVLMMQWIPALQGVGRSVYAVIVVLGILWLTPKTYTSVEGVSGLIPTALENFHHRKILDAAIFETTMMVVGMLAYQIIPSLSNINSMRFLGIFLFTLGWLLGMIAHQKN